ncbi:MAG: thiamine-phosphate kinase [Nitrososphaerales archaeon]
MDERQIIALIWKVLADADKLGSSNEDPFDDDVSWLVRKSKQQLMLAKCDMLVSSTDVPKSMSAEQIGMKAMTACVSDFAAKGVLPQFCLVSLALPKKNANEMFVTGLARGLKRASNLYSVKILAGDTNASRSDTVIDCAMFGFASKIVRRNGAKAGDLIGVSGKFGLQPCGLLILQNKATAKDSRFVRKAINAVLNPKAKLECGHKISKFLTSSIDSSDGLGISLYNLAEASGVNIELSTLPLADGVESFAKDNSKDATGLALFGGEEYEIICTYPPSHAKDLSEMGITSIGHAVSKKRTESPIVSFNGETIKRKGWTHFSTG